MNIGNCVLIILAIILIWIMLVRPRSHSRQAIPSVIQIFRDHSAVGEDNAKTLGELGLQFNIPKSLMGKTFRAPDPRFTALLSLMKASVVQRTEEGKFYLAEVDATDATSKETEDKQRGK